MRTSFSFTNASRTKLGAVILAAVLGVLAAGQISASMASPQAPEIQGEAR